MFSNNTFFDFISQQHLYQCAAGFGFVTAAIIIFIYAQLSIKKRRHFAKHHITSELNQWISEILLEDDAPTTISISATLQHYLRKPMHRQYITDSLITVVKNISGSATQNIKCLYLQLGLKQDSLAHLHSRKWHRKSRGIYELYMMGQEDTLSEIAQHTNSRNETVRHEAQVAMVGFGGFSGLSFLTTLTQPLHNWQQLKLLEQLNKLDIQPMNDLPQWLSSPNVYVQLFALKLTDIYQQFAMYPLVIQLLYAPQEHIRLQAVSTLHRIAASVPAELLGIFDNEPLANRRNILKVIRELGSEEHLPFLMAQLSHPDDSIKLEAARAIANCGGWQQLTTLTDTTLVSIVRQVKYEINA